MKYPTTYPDGCDPSISYNHTYNIWYAYTWFHTKIEVRTILYGLPLVLILGVLGNGSFLFVVGKIKRLHNNTNAYLGSLAVADIVYLIWSSSTILYSYWDSPVRHDTLYNTFVGCTLSFGFGYSLYFASIGLVTLVTYERYCGICFPFQYMAISSNGRTKRLITGTWLASFFLGFIQSLKHANLQKYCVVWPQLPDFVDWPQTIEFCMPLTENLNIALDLFDNFIFLNAMVFNGYMYARIMYSLGHRDVEDQQRGPVTQSQMQAARVRKQVARMLITNGTMFFLCQICSQINLVNYTLTRTVGVTMYQSATGSDTMLSLSRCMTYANSAINLFLYNFSSSFYREAYKEALCGKKLEKHSGTASRVKRTPTIS